MVRCGKKGATAVLITMILSSMLIAITVIQDSATERLKESVIDGAINLSCRSILSEYDIRLKDDYGIFAYRDYAEDVALKLMLYIKANTLNSFKPLNTSGVLVSAENNEYCIQDPNVLEEQIMRAGDVNVLAGKKGKTRDKIAQPEMIILNESLKKSLPTQGKDIKFFDINLFDGEKALLDRASSTFLLNQYIFSTFKSRTTDFPSRESVFDYEIEYIIGGKLSEEENLDKIILELALIREGLNVAHIVADKKKMAEIAAYIAGLPPAAGIVTEAIIIAAWAAVETENDIKLLLAGENVAFVKSEKQWAVPFYAAISSAFTDEYLKPNDKKGANYDDYLKALLYIQDRETKLLRIMDLIQMNMRTYYNGSFLIKDHYTGFEINALIDGKEYSYAHCY